MVSWRQVAGPAISLAVAAFVLLADRYLFRVPNPGAISFLAVAFSAYLGGVGPGLVSAAISFGLAVVLFSGPQLFDFTSDNLARLLVLMACTPAIAVMIGILQGRAQRVLQLEQAANAELESLRSALDQSEVGVLVLDKELQAQFMNRSFRRLWRVPDELAERKPSFVELAERGRDARTFAVPADRIDNYVAERKAHVSAGDERPFDIRLSNGEVIRSRCKVLANGGRMLTYGNVSDLVRSADEMAEFAMKDSLTGIYNRRHFMMRLDSEWKRYRRYERPLSLLLLDIDHFKSINDRYGHDAGDRVIGSVARCCGVQTRDSDVAARIGGEEFAILLPETDLAEACVVAERLRVAIAERPVSCNGQDIAVTISIGAAPAVPTLSDPAELMKRADAALYAAKRGGRNRVAAARADEISAREQRSSAAA
jgi:diguanylate cyclase (GGDEF)-like protein